VGEPIYNNNNNTQRLLITRDELVFKAMLEDKKEVEKLIATLAISIA
jgi:hypothetical protein